MVLKGGVRSYERGTPEGSVTPLGPLDRCTPLFDGCRPPVIGWMQIINHSMDVNHEWMHRKVDMKLPGKWISNCHGARPVHQIISMIMWIRTSGLSIKKSVSRTCSCLQSLDRCTPPIIGWMQVINRWVDAPHHWMGADHQSWDRSTPSIIRRMQPRTDAREQVFAAASEARNLA